MVTIFDRINEKYPENSKLVKDLLRIAKNGNEEEFMVNLTKLAERAAYVAEMGHNLGAKPPK